MICLAFNWMWCKFPLIGNVILNSPLLGLISSEPVPYLPFLSQTVRSMRATRKWISHKEYDSRSRSACVTKSSISPFLLHQQWVSQKDYDSRSRPPVMIRPKGNSWCLAFRLSACVKKSLGSVQSPPFPHHHRYILVMCSPPQPDPPQRCFRQPPPT